MYSISVAECEKIGVARLVYWNFRHHQEVQILPEGTRINFRIKRAGQDYEIHRTSLL